MKVVFTRIENIVSNKTGTPLSYIKVSYVDDQGNTDSIFATKEKMEAMGLEPKKVLTKDDLKAIFEKFDVSEVSYRKIGEKAYVESIR